MAIQFVSPLFDYRFWCKLMGIFYLDYKRLRCGPPTDNRSLEARAGPKYGYFTAHHRFEPYPSRQISRKGRKIKGKVLRRSRKVTDYSNSHPISLGSGRKEVVTRTVGAPARTSRSTIATTSHKSAGTSTSGGTASSSISLMKTQDIRGYGNIDDIARRQSEGDGNAKIMRINRIGFASRSRTEGCPSNTGGAGKTPRNGRKAEGLMMVLEREDVNFSTQWRSRGFGRDEMKPENTTQEHGSKEPNGSLKGESQTTKTPTGAGHMGI
ncbi:hypothetical protein B0H13DRAFT_1910432 [Mycena leptocephala]|nr:hypothetical protein B0H13DRAFT_1910432 [Mycena leptocephala]